MEYCRVAEMTPAMRPMNAAIKIERNESWTVKAKSLLEQVDHRFAVADGDAEVPCTAWEMKRKYWT